MKKIIIMFAAVVVAAVSQAASFNWSVNAGTSYAGYSVYLANGSTYATLEAIQSDLLGSSGNSGVLAKTSAAARSATASGAVAGLGENTSYDFYVVFVDANNNYWVSDKQSVTTKAESDTPPSFSIASNEGTSILNGTAAGTLAVPEPTSGVLLLIGIAGLALKRKKA